MACVFQYDPVKRSHRDLSGKRFCVNEWIVDRELVQEYVRSGSRKALDNRHVLIWPLEVVPVELLASDPATLAIEILCFDDKRVALPVTNGVPHPLTNIRMR